MDKQRLISHTMALEPGIQAYQAAAFALELVERLRTEGSEKTIRIAEKTAFQAILPGNVLSVHRVLANGITIPQTLPPTFPIQVDPAPGMDWGSGIYLTDNNGALLMCGSSYLQEGNVWDDNTYLADSDGKLLAEGETLLTV